VNVFNQSDPATDSNVPGWHDYLAQNVGEIHIVLTANKIGLPVDVFQWAGDRGIDIVRTSAMDGTNISALFESVAQNPIGRRPRRSRRRMLLMLSTGFWMNSAATPP
jgi:hypothetical protein